MSTHIGRHESCQEQDLLKQVVSLKAQLEVKEQDMAILTEQNKRGQERLAILTQTVAIKDFEKRRGYHNQDVDQYLIQVTQLASQLSDLEGKEKQYVRKIATLEQQLSKSTDVARLTKRVYDENVKLKSKMKSIESSLEHAQASVVHSTKEKIEVCSDTRHLTLEAYKVPGLKREVEELKKKLQDAEEETARKYEQKQMDHVMEVCISKYFVHACAMYTNFY